MDNTIRPVPDGLKGVVIGAMVCCGIYFLLALDMGAMLDVIAALAMGGVVYALIYRNLGADLATARKTSMGCAVMAGVFAVISLVTGDSISFVIDGTFVGCLAYAVKQLQDLEKVYAPAPAVATAGAPANASADVLDQLKKLGDLRAAGVLSEAEFAAEKAKLLSRA